MKSIFEYVANADDLVHLYHTLREQMNKLGSEITEAYKANGDYYTPSSKWLETDKESKKVRRNAVSAIKKCYELFGCTAPEINSFDYTMEHALRTIVCWAMQLKRITEQYDQ